VTKQTTIGICIVVENLPVPLDKRVWKEACALRDVGYRVSVICPKGKGYTAAYELRDGIEIYRHNSWEAAKISGYFLEYSWAFVAELFLTLRVFARSRFRILQGCNPPDTIFLIGLLMKLLGVRYIYDQHDLGPELFEAKFGRRGGVFYWIARVLELCSYRVANICITTNESFKEIAIARGGKSAESVFVVRNCPDLSKFRSSQRAVRNTEREFLTVAYVGFMGAQDGLDLLLESIEHIVKNHKRQDTRFVLVGGGTELPELRRIVGQKSLEGFVTFTGQVTHEEVADYLAASDLGVAPDPKNAMNDNSTMIKIFEYMAFGLPVVLFDLKEGRRTAGNAALYAAPNDPVDFANQMVKLLDSKGLRQQLGQCGRTRIEEGMNWDVEKKSLIRAYEQALQPHGAILQAGTR
jgi:glycosyltransferase involved in cell wall biosynthesis